MFWLLLGVDRLTLIELTKRNIRKNSRAYLVYFYPMVFSVMIYFTFVSLQYNREIVDGAKTLGKIGPAFMAASVFLMVFSALFIFYSNSFFMKKRKKEIALYSLFGMTKGKAGRMLFYENALVGAGALLVGIGLGAILSKLFAMVLVKLMGMKVVAGFSLSPAAAIQTVLVFFLIIAVTSGYNARMIYTSTLQELFRAEKKAEQKPQASTIMSFVSILMIGGGYWIILQSASSSLWSSFAWQKLLGSIVLLIIGTYLFIRAFLIFLLRFIARKEKFFYKGSNMLSLTNLLYRIKGNMMVLAVLSLLTTFALFLMGTTWSFYANLNQVSEQNFPHSFLYTIPNKEAEKEIKSLFAKRKDIRYGMKLETVKLAAGPDFLEKFPPDYPVLLIPESSFKKLAGNMGKKDVEFTEGEAVSFYDGTLNRSHDPYTGKSLQLPGGETVTVGSYEPYSLLNQIIFAFPLVVKDSVYEKAKQAGGQVENLQIYKLGREKETKKLNDSIEEVLFSHTEKEVDVIWSSFYKQYEQGMETYGILIFISGFLGLVFLTATGSVLYYRMLSEAEADKPRYQILKKIGLSSKEMKRTIRFQTMFVFSVPLVIAILHSSVLMTALARFAGIAMSGAFALVLGMYMLLFFGYFYYTSTRFYKLVYE
ncbi:ABC transporter permease [Neobacillus notoginsengisoli]|uniref:ABC transporter permease n=1 Tax=Neobacillus notoginsengisoli TaxID=1578198 RepID=A0A417YQ32_9BACI|nr:ABC transporter permease [Neobacillus notoginsengisoli]RHW35698.1 ABC transporter permease [Neobacillus notoginsengisoli]